MKIPPGNGEYSHYILFLTSDEYCISELFEKF